VLSSGNPAAQCSTKDPQEDIEYLHEDDRGATVAVESKAQGNTIAWEAVVSPLGQIMWVGLPGPSGQPGDGTLPATIDFAPTPGGPDGQLLTIGLPVAADAGRTMTVTSNVGDGGPSYTPGSAPMQWTFDKSRIPTWQAVSALALSVVGQAAKYFKLGASAEAAADFTTIEAYSAGGLAGLGIAALYIGTTAPPGQICGYNSDCIGGYYAAKTGDYSCYYPKVGSYNGPSGSAYSYPDSSHTVTVGTSLSPITPPLASGGGQTSTGDAPDQSSGNLVPSTSGEITWVLYKQMDIYPDGYQSDPANNTYPLPPDFWKPDFQNAPLPTGPSGTQTNNDPNASGLPPGIQDNPSGLPPGLPDPGDAYGDDD
jgi:hypothetical protein